MGRSALTLAQRGSERQAAARAPLGNRPGRYPRGHGAGELDGHRSRRNFAPHPRRPSATRRRGRLPRLRRRTRATPSAALVQRPVPPTTWSWWALDATAGPQQRGAELARPTEPPDVPGRNGRGVRGMLGTLRCEERWKRRDVLRVAPERIRAPRYARPRAAVPTSAACQPAPARRVRRRVVQLVMVVEGGLVGSGELLAL